MHHKKCPEDNAVQQTSGQSQADAKFTYEDALKMALLMEIKVTKLIYDVTTGCNTDYHAADVFTNPILDEQHKSVRQLQGALRAYKDITDKAATKEMGEYIFDYRLLKGEF